MYIPTEYTVYYQRNETRASSTKTEGFYIINRFGGNLEFGRTFTPLFGVSQENFLN